MVATWENFKMPFWKKYLNALQLKLTKYVRITISLLYIKSKKPKFRCLELVLAKFSIFAYISLKSANLSLAMTVTSYLGCWYLFWYVWKKEASSLLNYRPMYRRFSFKFTGGVTYPLVRMLQKKLPIMHSNNVAPCSCDLRACAASCACMKKT